MCSLPLCAIVQVAKLDDKVEKIQSEKMLLRDHIAEAKRLYREQQKETHKHKVLATEQGGHMGVRRGAWWSEGEGLSEG